MLSKINLCDLLKEKIASLCDSCGEEKNNSQMVLLIIVVPLKRSENESIGRNYITGFLLKSNFCDLGESLGCLYKVDKKYFNVPIISTESGLSEPFKYRNIEIGSLAICFSNNLSYARKSSAIIEEKAVFKGIIAGVGSLGSALVELWSLEAWGEWTVVDMDLIEPHNITRHISNYWQTGMFKVDAVCESICSKYYPNYFKINKILDSIIKFENPDIVNSIKGSDLIIDSSTTLEVPRELSIIDYAPRCISTFFTPNGFNSVVLIEDVSRKIRLDSLEALAGPQKLVQ